MASLGCPAPGWFTSAYPDVEFCKKNSQSNCHIAAIAQIPEINPHSGFTTATQQLRKPQPLIRKPAIVPPKPKKGTED
jgi:hypothetical protein